MEDQIFIFGYYGWKNVGDEAMLYALLRELNSIKPESRFAVLSLLPVIVPPEAKDKTRNVKPSIFAIAKEVLKSSTFAIGGGTHLFDYGDKMKALKRLLRIFLLVLYARLLHKKVYILGNGLGPLETRWAEFLVRSICCMADYISVRDKVSYKFLMDWGCTHKASLTFDLSVLIEPSSSENDYDSGENKYDSAENGKMILGICVTPVFELYHGSKEKDFVIVDEISKYVNNWLKQESRAEVRLFIFHGQSRDDDVSITRLLQQKLQPPERVKLVPYDPHPGKMLAQVGKCTAFIGMKYHSCVFAYINGLPLLIISYHPKCRAFAEEIGLPNYAIISLKEILNGKFGVYFEKFIRRPSEFVATLPIDVAKRRAKRGVVNR